MADSNMNPLGSLYKSFLSLLNNMTIKYSVKAEECETMETTKKANEYLDAINKRDNFFTYIDYTIDEYRAAGIKNKEMLEKALRGNTEVIPTRFRNTLLEIRRKRAIVKFEETNNYYRTLNGLPNIEEKERHFFYVSKAINTEYGIATNIPIHKIQDYYNEESPGLGDYYISILEGLGYINRLIEANPTKEYLKFLGSNRIGLEEARKAKNFQILQLKEEKVKHSLYDQFIQVYEQCREYFVKTIYIREYRGVIDYYDNFIAMCIFIMTIQQIVMRQISMGIKREFFDIFAMKALYQAYNVPFNQNIDEDTQAIIIRNLNILIQNKSTNKVIYNIAELLGFSDVKVYKYYLAREHKFDLYGLPIETKIEKFNSDKGEVIIGPDEEKTFDLYFQKSELNDENFLSSFNNSVNRVEYEDVIREDPYWWEDQNLLHRVWETEYNFVESKYLSLGISYSLTDMMFENTLLLKLLMQKSKEIENVTITLTRITGNTPIPLFDVIITLVCLMACKHNLYGEIITIPTQVINVLDYMQNVEQTDMLVDTFAFNFDYFKMDNEEGQKHIKALKEVMGAEEYEEFMSYISVLYIDSKATSEKKIEAINKMYKNIKSLYKFLSYHMTATDDYETYRVLKTMYNAAFYSAELRDVFTITGKYTGEQRTAWDYFEFLYHRNPKLYNALFYHDGIESYEKYLKEHELIEEEFSYEEFQIQIELGEVKIRYDYLIGEIEEDVSVKEEKIYYYVNHIIAKLQTVIDNLHYMYMMGNTVSPIEELLLKLIRFFKSYTVDLLGIDTILICDLKPDNLIKLYDQIWYIEKWICPEEQFRISYSDVIHHISTDMTFDDLLKLRDQLLYDAFLYITRKHDITTNEVLFRDTIEYSKEFETRDETSLYDTLSISNTLPLNEKLSFRELGIRDRIVKLWYSSDDKDSFDPEPEEENEEIN